LFVPFAESKNDRTRTIPDHQIRKSEIDNIGHTTSCVEQQGKHGVGSHVLSKLNLSQQWPHNNPAFGMSYADPSSKDCIRIASRFSTVYAEEKP
jgi:hypothetical protein